MSNPAYQRQRGTHRATAALKLALCLILTACGGAGPDATTADLREWPASSQGSDAPSAIEPVAPATYSADLQGVGVPLGRSGLSAKDLAVVVIEGNARSEAIGQAYLQLRGVPAENLVRVPLPSGNPLVSVEDFARARLQFESRVPAHVQASVLAFAEPSRVLGPSCAMSITSAMAFGYDAAWCGGCARTRASPYFNSSASRPWDQHRLRPSMMLPTSSLAEAQTWISRGIAADNSWPSAAAWLVRTSDAARSVRYPDFQSQVGVGQAQGLTVHYLDARAGNSGAAEAAGVGTLFYFTGSTWVADIRQHQWLPGAVADHLTSYAGMLPDANGQMPLTEWLKAGATASYGSVEEPCNHVEKFPRVSVLLDHYLRGDTLIEAYWKSVAWPGQGLFVGEPLARPFSVGI